MHQLLHIKVALAVRQNVDYRLTMLIDWQTSDVKTNKTKSNWSMETNMYLRWLPWNAWGWTGWQRSYDERAIGRHWWIFSHKSQKTDSSQTPYALSIKYSIAKQLLESDFHIWSLGIVFKIGLQNVLHVSDIVGDHITAKPREMLQTLIENRD